MVPDPRLERGRRTAEDAGNIVGQHGRATGSAPREGGEVAVDNGGVQAMGSEHLLGERTCLAN